MNTEPNIIYHTHMSKYTPTKITKSYCRKSVLTGHSERRTVGFTFKQVEKKHLFCLLNLKNIVLGVRRS